MADISIDRIIADLIRREGGFVNDPADRGGVTKYGITRRTLARWRGKPVSIDDMKALTKAEAAQIYRQEYVEKPGFGQIEFEKIRAFMVDAGVLHGPATATKWLQKIIGAKQDGILGPKTRRRLVRVRPPVLIGQLVGEWCRYDARLAQTDANKVAKGTMDPIKSRARTIAGWINRATAWLN